jgi:hypothetical protein
LLILISSAHFPFIFLTLLLFIFIQVHASVFSPAPLFFSYLDQLSSELVVILSHFERVFLHLKLIAFAAFEQLIVIKLYFNFKLVFLSLVELELVREQIYFLYLLLLKLIWTLLFHLHHSIQKVRHCHCLSYIFSFFYLLQFFLLKQLSRMEYRRVFFILIVFIKQVLIFKPDY